MSTTVAEQNENIKFDINSLSEMEGVIPVEGVSKRLLEKVFNSEICGWLGNKLGLAKLTNGEDMKDFYGNVGSWKIGTLDCTDAFNFKIAYFTLVCLRGESVSEQKIVFCQKLSQILVNSVDPETLEFFESMIAVKNGEGDVKGLDFPQKKLDNTNLVAMFGQLAKALEGLESTGEGFGDFRQQGLDVLTKFFDDNQEAYFPRKSTLTVDRVQSDLSQIRQEKTGLITGIQSYIEHLIIKGKCDPDFIRPLVEQHFQFASVEVESIDVETMIDDTLTKLNPTETSEAVDNCSTIQELFDQHCTLTGNTQLAWNRLQKNSPRFTTVIFKTLEIVKQLVSVKGGMTQKINSLGTDYKRHPGVSDLVGYTIFNLDRGNRIVIGNELVDGKIEIKGYGKDGYKH